MTTSEHPTRDTPPASITLLRHGHYWDELGIGQRFQTIRRRINEADLSTFVCLCGMFTEGFLNGVSGDGVLQGRAVPGALTHSMIEGLIVQTMLNGTGLALLESSQVMHKPVQVGDTIHGIVEIAEVRPTREHGRAVVTSRISIINQRDECVMTYETKRMHAARPA